MALSFEDSLKAAKAESEAAAAVAAMPVVADDTSVMTLDYGIVNADEGSMIAAYSGDDGSWIQDDNYLVIPFFHDENISKIDDEKNINLNKKQTNITQEENSQYIPFEMSRYYDGFDLSKRAISIHYETSDNQHGVSIPVNVAYNEEKLRFAWLADAGVTRSAGKLKFEIHVTGYVEDDNGNVIRDKNGKAYGYVWKYEEEN